MSDKTDTIGGEYLAAIDAGLAEFAPDLQHRIRTLLRKDAAVPGAYRVGASIYPEFSVNLRYLDARAILDTLKAVEQKHGYNKTYCDRQINLLVCVWKKHTERLRQEESQSS